MGNYGDIWVPRLVVIFLGMVSMVAVVAATIISIEGREIPPVVAALGTSAITTLGIIATVLYRPVPDRKPNGG